MVRHLLVLAAVALLAASAYSVPAAPRKGRRESKAAAKRRASAATAVPRTQRKAEATARDARLTVHAATSEGKTIDPVGAGAALVALAEAETAEAAAQEAAAVAQTAEVAARKAEVDARAISI
jgi:hypothetical protein